MKITLKEDGYVDSFALLGDIVDGVEVDDLLGDELEAFLAGPTAYRLVDGRLELDAEKRKADEDLAIVEQLRLAREKICFPVINRGWLWYAALTAERMAELSKWYRAWLDVTETRTAPETPAWLK